MPEHDCTPVLVIRSLLSIDGSAYACLSHFVEEDQNRDKMGEISYNAS